MIEYKELIQILNFDYNFNIKNLKELNTNILKKMYAFTYKNKKSLIKFDIYNKEHIDFRNKLMNKILINNNQNLDLSSETIIVIFYMIFHHNENYLENNYNYQIIKKLEKELLYRQQFNFVNNVKNANQ